jgi:hypothetical protein
MPTVARAPARCARATRATAGATRARRRDATPRGTTARRRDEIVRRGARDRADDAAAAPVDAFDAVKRGAASLALALTLSAHACAPASARLEGVNNPALLPPGPAAPVLDVAGYLTKSDVARLTTEVEALEKDTGVRLRVLAQAYPQTPGLAVKEYWNVDDDTVVFVADPGLGNILNFSVGGNLDLEIPPSFWSRLANKYGTKFYWSERGEEASISAAVRAIDACAREPSGRAKCSKIMEYDDGGAGGFTDGDAPKGLGKFFK